jgi:8-oxo-dGTP diphosphatase
MEIGIDYPGITTPFYCHDGKGNFLLHKRSKNTRDEHGTWDTGSGKLDFGLDVDQNVLKEVKEEYGCEGIVEEQLPAHSIFRFMGGHNTHWLSIPCFVRVDPAHVRNNEPHKIDEIGWFRLDALPEPLHTGFSQTLRRFRERFEKYR